VAASRDPDNRLFGDQEICFDNARGNVDAAIPEVYHVTPMA
jgi:hypothetical protein